MGSDLAKLYRELADEKQTPEIKRLRKNIEDKLNDKLRVHFLEMLEIGGVIGYGKLESELAKATELVGQMKKAK